MERENQSGLVFYRFPGLNGSGVIQTVLTRRGGISAEPYATLNLGHTVGDDPAAVEENHERVLGTLDIDRRQIVSPHQVHGTNVRFVGRDDGGTIQEDTDGLLTTTPGVALLLRFADCVPILLFDPVRRAVGLIHAGWRGAAGRVVAAAVRVFSEHAGSRPGDLWAGVGPAIGPCCYQVDDDVASAVSHACPDGSEVTRRQNGTRHLDLPGAVRAQLVAAGVGRIEMAGLCTACHVDEWFSHRAEKGHTGRFGVLVMLE